MWPLVMIFPFSVYLNLTVFQQRFPPTSGFFPEDKITWGRRVAWKGLWKLGFSRFTALRTAGGHSVQTGLSLRPNRS